MTWSKKYALAKKNLRSEEGSVTFFVSLTILSKTSEFQMH